MPWTEFYHQHPLAGGPSRPQPAAAAAAPAAQSLGPASPGCQEEHPRQGDQPGHDPRPDLHPIRLLPAVQDHSGHLWAGECNKSCILQVFFSIKPIITYQDLLYFFCKTDFLFDGKGEILKHFLIK